MKSYHDAERQKSMIGNINMSSISTFKENDSKNPSSLLQKKNLGFFSFEPTTFQLKQADWLDKVCFTPTTPDYIKR